jgi:hypothetical protein
VENERETTELRQRVAQLEKKLSDISSVPSPVSYAAAVGDQSGVKADITSGVNLGGPHNILDDRRRSTKSKVSPRGNDRRLNLIIFGLDESDGCSSRTERLNMDLEKISSVFTNLDSSITSEAVQDHLRLGKFILQSKRPRPILVKFLRSTDVNSILSRARHCDPTIRIRQDHSPEERLKQKCLMNIRWSLIQSGIERNCIKIRKSALFVNNTMLGCVDSKNTFVYEDKTTIEFPIQSSTTKDEEAAEETSNNSNTTGSTFQTRLDTHVASTSLHVQPNSDQGGPTADAAFGDFSRGGPSAGDASDESSTGTQA